MPEGHEAERVAHLHVTRANRAPPPAARRRAAVINKRAAYGGMARAISGSGAQVAN